MRIGAFHAGRRAVALAAALVLATGCSAGQLRHQLSGSASDEGGAEVVPVQEGAPSSAAGSGRDPYGWTTPPRPGELPPPRVYSGEGAPMPPPPASSSVVQGPGTFPPPPPPPAGGPTWSPPPPMETYPGGPPCPPGPVVVQSPWSGCRLPCEEGISMWHVRAVAGYAFYFGDDPADSCGYFGLDFGRTFCGCWGLDGFYRYHEGRFDRDNPPEPEHDGGSFHHLGVKLTYERSLTEAGNRFYWWAGLGPEYFWTSGYLDDDSGFGLFAEAGVGYLVNQNFRIRAGVNVHALWTDVTREDPADDGDTRLLWVVAPVIQAEVDF